MNFQEIVNWGKSEAQRPQRGGLDVPIIYPNLGGLEVSF